MNDEIKLHGRLPDQQLCKLIIKDAEAILEIAADSGRWSSMAGTDRDPSVVELTDGRTATLMGLYLAPGTHSVVRGQSAFALTRVGARA
jgi:hypothetical protein